MSTNRKNPHSPKESPWPRVGGNREWRNLVRVEFRGVMPSSHPPGQSPRRESRALRVLLRGSCPCARRRDGTTAGMRSTRVRAVANHKRTESSSCRRFRVETSVVTGLPPRERADESVRSERPDRAARRVIPPRANASTGPPDRSPERRKAGGRIARGDRSERSAAARPNHPASRAQPARRCRASGDA